MIFKFLFLFSLIFLLFVNPSQTDLCNFHGTLFEAETFYLTQPYTKTISLDLENYQTAFHTFPKKLETFSNLFKLYEKDADLETYEPHPLIPLDSNTNIFRTPLKTTGSQAISECARNNGTLLALSNSNRNKILEAMKSLGLQKVPFLSHNFHKIFSIPNMEVLDDKVEYKTIEAILFKSPAFLKLDNSFQYPTEVLVSDLTTKNPNLRTTISTSTTTTTTTTSNPSISSTTSGSSTTTEIPLENETHYSLCTKPNNPWDRESSRRSWLKLVPQIKNAIKFLQELSHTYTQTVNTLSKLPSPTSPVNSISQSLKLILPDPLKAILDFLDRFSKKQHWESTTPSALDLFSTFVKDTFKAIKLFKLDSSITNIKAKPMKRFRLLNFNDLHWKDFFDLDEETYGLSGPISVTPTERQIDDDNTIFTAEVRFRIFHRQHDKCTIYKFKPNIIENQIVNIKSILHTSKYNLASKEELIPHDCHTQPAELHRICHKLPSSAFEPHRHTHMTECGSALLNKDYDKKHAFCPLTYPPSDPSIYRADCQTDENSTLIVSSTKPIIELAFVCDSKFDKTVKLEKFPSKIYTDCEARLVDANTPGLVVPQRNPDFLQDPLLGPILHYLQPTNITPPFPIPLYAIIIIATGSSLVLIALIVLCLYFLIRKSKQQNLGPPVQSGTFRIVSTNPSLIELRNITTNRPANNDYPFLN